MPTDKKISQLPVASSINASDISVLVDAGTDYQYTFTLLLQFLAANLSVGANISFGTGSIPSNSVGNNGDLYIKTNTGQFAQRNSGTWSVVYTIPAGVTGSKIYYGISPPGYTLGIDGDTFIQTAGGIFYLKVSGTWYVKFSMATGPAGPRGNSVLNGTIDPTSTDGLNGDFWLNTTSKVIFGPKSGGAWPGTGTVIKGMNGNTLLSGSTNPANTLGNNGDYYLNDTTYYIFGPKAGGLWPSGVTIIGAGLPSGGTTGQILKKFSNTDFATDWEDLSFANIAGLPTDNTNLNTSLGTLQTNINNEASARASADTTLQSNINAEATRATAAEANKVDKVTGFGLSSNDYTSTEKTKLANLSEHFVGVYSSAAALIAAHPTGVDGQYATVESSGNPGVTYIWDTINNAWIQGGTGHVTSVNSQTGAVSLNTDNIGEGSSNLYFTAARVLAAVLSGISFLTSTPIVSTDSVLQAFGKLQAQINNLFFAGGLLTGYVSGAGTISAADTILQGIQKLNGNVALKAPLASPALTGTPTAPTAASLTNNMQVATTAYVDGAAATQGSRINYNFYQSTL
ncbi:MAG: hypothetical protein JWQ57_2243 [Mucilaginibacter sp.]|nr:hypothetical protein [Mucilaginibacter sp.]